MFTRRLRLYTAIITWTMCSPGSRLRVCSAAMVPPRPLRVGAGRCDRHSSLLAVTQTSHRPSVAAAAACGSSSASKPSVASLQYDRDSEFQQRRQDDVTTSCQVMSVIRTGSHDPYRQPITAGMLSGQQHSRGSAQLGPREQRKYAALLGCGAAKRSAQQLVV